jgi:hypothetical protein
MASQWFYARNGQRHGPVNSAQLTALAKSGQLSPADLIWKEGMTQWVPAGNSPQLFPKGQGPIPVAVPQDNAALPTIAVTAVKPTRSRKKYRGLIASIQAIAVGGLLFGSAYYFLEKNGTGEQRPGGRMPNVPYKATAYQEFVLEPRSAGDQESLRKRSRQITLQMSEDELPQVMGCKWDSRYRVTDSLSEENVIAWDTGGLGIVVVTQRVIEAGVPSRKVVCVVEGNSGYHIGAPP